MRRVCQAAGLCFFAVALFVVWKSLGMKYYSSFGPGPGFFPFWLGALLAVLSIAWVAQVTFRQAEPMKEGFIPGRAGKLSIVAVFLALVLVTWLMEIIGFRLTMLGFQLFLLIVLGCAVLVGEMSQVRRPHDEEGLTCPGQGSVEECASRRASPISSRRGSDWSTSWNRS